MTANVQALSEREKETLRLLLEVHDAKSIARNLGISVYTVNERLRTARRKLDVSSSREAARTLARSEQWTYNSVVNEHLGVAGAAAHGNVGRGHSELKGLQHPFALAVGETLIMSLIIATAMLMWGVPESREPGPLPNWSTTTIAPRGDEEPTNTVLLDGNRLLWNGEATSEATIMEFLAITGQLNPQPVLILSYTAQTGAERVQRLRLLIDGVIQCKPDRCIEFAV